MSAGTAAGREVLPDEAYAAALLGLPALWPARLAALLGLRRGRRGADRGTRRSARAAWDLVRRGRAADVPGVRSLLTEADPDAIAAHWAAAACRVDVGRAWPAYRRLGARVDILGDAGYPTRLAEGPGAPYVLFRSGTRPELEGRTAAVVGTRRCTPVGRAIASEFGAALAEAGVRVVSGLALGVDGAAHQGALDAGSGAPIGVVAGGFDRPYPVRHRPLWQRVAAAGTNRLLRDGAQPACGVDDVLAALSLADGATAATDRRPPPSGVAAGALAAMGWDPVTTDLLASRTGLPPAELAVALAHLELDGWIAGGAGHWQRIGSADRAVVSRGA